VSGPVRVQLSRAAGWRMPENKVKVDRSTRWGNPFIVRDGPYGQQAAVSSFRAMLTKHGFWWPHPLPYPPGKVPAGEPNNLDDVRRELRGKNLACWCGLDVPCHADVLLDLANRPVCEAVP
jgi:uncharacterized protein DUF4326